MVTGSAMMTSRSQSMLYERHVISVRRSLDVGSITSTASRIAHVVRVGLDHVAQLKLVQVAENMAVLVGPCPNVSCHDDIAVLAEIDAAVLLRNVHDRLVYWAAVATRDA